MVRRPIAAATAWAETAERQASAGMPVQSSAPEPAGQIFGVPVSMDNYRFARAVAVMFPPPWGAAGLPPDKQEESVWENLILHYKAYQRVIQAPDADLEKMVDDLLRNEKQSFTRQGDPVAYQKWVRESVGESVEMLENQVRYLIQIRKLKDQVLEMQKVTVSEAEMQQEFFNEQNHVGGEMVTFDAREQAQAFFEEFKDPNRWNKMKAKGKYQVRPVSLMTLEAYIDLWGIPRDQMYAFHALEIGAVGPPMPFGKQWCVYRLLDKRTGDLKDFPKEREGYYKRVEQRKKYQGLQQWIKDLKDSADLKVFIRASAP